MSSFQGRAQISQTRRNPTVKPYAEMSKRFAGTNPINIDLTKRVPLDVVGPRNSSSEPSYLSDESSLEDYGSKTSRSSFSSTASLVDQLGGTFSEPELISGPKSVSASPPSPPIILTKAPKPVGVFSVADFMKSVQAAPPTSLHALTAPSHAPPPDDASLKRSSAYSQSSKEPMTSLDPQEEEHTWASGNNVNRYVDQDVDSSGLPPYHSSDNSVLSDSPEYDQNYDQLHDLQNPEQYYNDWGQAQGQTAQQDLVQNMTPQQSIAPSPPPISSSSPVPAIDSDTAVFSQVNPLFTRLPREELISPQYQASELDQLSRREVNDTHVDQYKHQSNTNSVTSQRLPLDAPDVAYSSNGLSSVAIDSFYAPAPPPTLSPNVKDTPQLDEEIEVDEPPPPPPLNEDNHHSYHHHNTVKETVDSGLLTKDVGTEVTERSSKPSRFLRSQQLPAQLQLEADDTDDLVLPTESYTCVSYAKTISNNTHNTQYEKEYSTFDPTFNDPYSHYFHTPLDSQPTPVSVPVVPVKNQIVVSNSVNHSCHSISPTYSASTTINPILSAQGNAEQTVPASPPNAATNLITQPATSEVSVLPVTTSPNTNTANLALTTTSSRYRGRYLSPNKVHASLLTATATPAMSSPVPDSSRVDKNRNKKSLSASGTLSDTIKTSDCGEEGNNADRKKSIESAENITVNESVTSASKSVNRVYDINGHNTTDTAGSLYSNNMDVLSAQPSGATLDNTELLMQYKTSLLLQSQLIDKILQQKGLLQECKDSDQLLRLQISLDITTEMLQKTSLESAILGSAIFPTSFNPINTNTNTQDSGTIYTQSTLSVGPAVSSNFRAVSRGASTSRTLMHDHTAASTLAPPLKHRTYGPHAVAAAPPRTTHSALRGSAISANVTTQPTRSTTPTSHVTRSARSNTPNTRTLHQSPPPPSPLYEQTSTPGAVRGDSIRRTPMGTIISSPLAGALGRASSVNRASKMRSTAKVELSRVNTIQSRSTPTGNMVVTPIKLNDGTIEIVASTMHSSMQLFPSTPLTYDTFRRNASLVNSMLGTIDNYCNCCRTKLIDMDAQKNLKLKHSQCKNCLHIETRRKIQEE